MLGRKEDMMNGIAVSITQHAFVTELLHLIYPGTPEFYREIRNLLRNSKNNREHLNSLTVKIDKARYPFWEFYIQSREDGIRKTLDNYFRAVQSVFPSEWTNQELILSKTVGYGALMRQLVTFVPRGIREGILSLDFFKRHLAPARENLGDRPLTVDEWGSSEASITKLRLAMFSEIATTQVARA